MARTRTSEARNTRSAPLVTYHFVEHPLKHAKSVDEYQFKCGMSTQNRDHMVDVGISIGEVAKMKLLRRQIYSTISGSFWISGAYRMRYGIRTSIMFSKIITAPSRSGNDTSRIAIMADHEARAVLAHLLASGLEAALTP